MAGGYRQRYYFDAWRLVVCRGLVACVLLLLAVSPSVGQAVRYYASPCLDASSPIEFNLTVNDQLDKILLSKILERKHLNLPYVSSGDTYISIPAPSNSFLDANYYNHPEINSNGNNVTIIFYPNDVIPSAKVIDTDLFFWLSYQKTTVDNVLDYNGTYIVNYCVIYSIEYERVFRQFVSSYTNSSGYQGTRYSPYLDVLNSLYVSSSPSGQVYGVDSLNVRPSASSEDVITWTTEEIERKYLYIRYLAYGRARITISSGVASDFSTSNCDLVRFPLLLSANGFLYHYRKTDSNSGSGSMWAKMFNPSSFVGHDVSSDELLDAALSLARGRSYGKYLEFSGEFSLSQKWVVDSSLSTLIESDGFFASDYLRRQSLDFYNNLSEYDTDNGGEPDISEFVNKHNIFNSADDVLVDVPPVEPWTLPKDAKSVSDDADLVELDKTTTDWLEYLQKKEAYEQKKLAKETVGDPEEEYEKIKPSGEETEPQGPTYIDAYLPELDPLSTPYDLDDSFNIPEVDIDLDQVGADLQDFRQNITDSITGTYNYRLLRELFLPLNRDEWPVFVYHFGSGVMSSNIPCDLYDSAYSYSGDVAQVYRNNTYWYDGQEVKIPSLLESIVIDFNILANTALLRILNWLRTAFALLMYCFIARKLLLLYYEAV